MCAVLDAAIQVHAALAAGVPLNGRLGVDHRQFLGMLGDPELVARHHCDQGEQRALGLPALGAAAGVIVGRLRGNLHPHGVLGAAADEGAAGEILGTRLDAVVDRRVNRKCVSHDHLPSCEREKKVPDGHGKRPGRNLSVAAAGEAKGHTALAAVLDIGVQPSPLSGTASGVGRTQEWSQQSVVCGETAYCFANTSYALTHTLRHTFARHYITGG
ncbi:hypothetical protein D3C80_1432220 [compost metagenome]